MKQQIAKWIEEGHLEEAILGENEYFIGNITYRSNHDISYVIQETILWAKKENKINYFSDRITHIICEQLKNNLIKAVEILLSLALVTKDLKTTISIDFSKINDIIKKQLSVLNGPDSPEKTKIIQSIDKMKKDFPKFDLKKLINAIKKDLPEFLPDYKV